MNIGFIGLGAMGRAMAKNLAARGHDVRAWNRSGGALEGVTVVGSPLRKSDTKARPVQPRVQASVRPYPESGSGAPETGIRPSPSTRALTVRIFALTWTPASRIGALFEIRMRPQLAAASVVTTASGPHARLPYPSRRKHETMMRIVARRCIPLPLGTLRFVDSVQAGVGKAPAARGSWRFRNLRDWAWAPVWGWFRAWTRIYAADLCRARNLIARAWHSGGSASGLRLRLPEGCQA